MLELGKKQLLTVVKKVDFGVYLSEKGADPEKKEERVLLPARQVPEGAAEGTELEVFLYKDSMDRLIATTRTPKLCVGETAVLPVAETGRIGAFLEWGLEKDLLLPFREQTGKVSPGDEVLAALYVDKSGRLCATMKVYHYLKTDSPYTAGDSVEGRVYEISKKFGVFVAEDDCYSALITRQDAQGSIPVGQKLQLHEDAALVREALRRMGGRLNFDDKASPEKINQELGLSKAAFKRAVGHLLKEQEIRLEKGGITLNHIASQKPL